LLALCVLGACRRTPLPPEAAFAAVDASPRADLASPRVPRLEGVPLLEGPTRYREAGAGGVGIDVPEGWSAFRAKGAFVRLVHMTSGVTVTVWIFDEPTAPSAWLGCSRESTDQVGRYRIVPALFPATSRSCLPDVAMDPLRKGWYGSIGERTVHVEALLPVGTFITADALLGSVLGSLKAD
jgi:hypothetical protein